ncbi:MAG TPA: DMT family transporter [Gemmatimonadaceae bacterium]|nr:DMT family transporter [Gemmatimonadaceae bacterium]
MVLVGVLFAISTSGPLVRLSSAPPLAIATWRVGFALLSIAVALSFTGGWRQLRAARPADVRLAMLSGALLALHFWTWNASLRLTTVAAAVVLVNMHPPIVALLSAVWLREKPTRIQVVGIAVAMIGATIVGLADAARAPAGDANDPVFGDILALIGAAAVAVYFVVGRRLRASYDLWPYVAMVYGACFVCLLAASLAMRVPLRGYSGREYLIFAAIAAGPMMLGHTGMNYALRYLPAFVVNLIALGEPVGATILALLIPAIREIPSTATILGGVVTLGGVVLAAATVRRRPLPADAARAID